MTPGKRVLAALSQIADAAATLPEGARVVVEWADAPLDLLLLIGVHGDARVGEIDGESVDEAMLTVGSVEVRAWRRQPIAPKKPKLALVKP